MEMYFHLLGRDMIDYSSNIKQAPAVPPHLIVEAEKHIKC